MHTRWFVVASLLFLSMSAYADSPPADSSWDQVSAEKEKGYEVSKLEIPALVPVVLKAIKNETLSTEEKAFVLALGKKHRLPDKPLPNALARHPSKVDDPSALKAYLSQILDAQIDALEKHCLLLDILRDSINLSNDAGKAPPLSPEKAEDALRESRAYRKLIANLTVFKKSLDPPKGQD